MKTCNLKRQNFECVYSVRSVYTNTVFGYKHVTSLFLYSGIIISRSVLVLKIEMHIYLRPSGLCEVRQHMRIPCHPNSFCLLQTGWNPQLTNPTVVVQIDSWKNQQELSRRVTSAKSKRQMRGYKRSPASAGKVLTEPKRGFQERVLSDSDFLNKHTTPSPDIKPTISTTADHLYPNIHKTDTCEPSFRQLYRQWQKIKKYEQDRARATFRSMCELHSRKRSNGKFSLQSGRRRIVSVSAPNPHNAKLRTYSCSEGIVSFDAYVGVSTLEGRRDMQYLKENGRIALSLLRASQLPSAKQWLSELPTEHWQRIATFCLGNQTLQKYEKHVSAREHTPILQLVGNTFGMCVPPVLVPCNSYRPVLSSIRPHRNRNMTRLWQTLLRTHGSNVLTGAEFEHLYKHTTIWLLLYAMVLRPATTWSMSETVSRLVGAMNTFRGVVVFGNNSIQFCPKPESYAFSRVSNRFRCLERQERLDRQEQEFWTRHIPDKLARTIKHNLRIFSGHRVSNHFLHQPPMRV